jgi:lipopolysaccharide/colanic/teichoic acid biosynthesis glycosyltransferase
VLIARVPLDRKGTVLMNRSKRAFDLIVLGLVLLPAGLVSALAAAMLLIVQGRPVLFGSERMMAPGQPFMMWKFRTMTIGVIGVTGGHAAGRITPLGRILRNWHLDELPQLWNILQGHMSFVGPRPPLRRVVDRLPQLYSEVLRSRPGLTGFASLLFSAREARLLAGCISAAETEHVYLRCCVVRKARLDMIYLHNRSLRLDIAILARTVVEPFVAIGGRKYHPQVRFLPLAFRRYLTAGRASRKEI